MSGFSPGKPPGAFANIPQGTSFHLSSDTQGANLTFTFEGESFDAPESYWGFSEWNTERERRADLATVLLCRQSFHPGTGIWIWGETTCNWEADLDELPFVFELTEGSDDPNNYPDSVIGGWPNLKPGEHTMTIRPLCQKGQRFAFDKAVYSVETGAR